MNTLPTEFGSVIGYAKYFKGRVHFYSAVLSQGIQGKEFVWWVSGEEDPRTPEELLEEFGDDYIFVGTVEIDIDALDRATVLDRELNRD